MTTASDILRYSGEKGRTIGVLLRSDTTDKIFDGTEMVDEDPSALTTYALANLIPETGTSPNTGHYRKRISEFTVVPPADKYHVTFYDTGYTDDPNVLQAVIQWDGTAIVDDLVTGTSNADICNMALSHLGIGTELANLNTDDGQEAEACRRFFETVRDMVLRDFAFPFAIRTGALALIDDEPNDEWGYVYRYPSNCLYVRRILSGSRQDSRASRIPFKIEGDDSGRLIYTDQEDAEIEYVVRATNPTRYTPDFVLALSYLLAFHIAPRLARENRNLRLETLELYKQHIANARANAANEDVPDYPLESEFILERE